MFRNQYDQDVTTFAPNGRLHQVEYAMEAVKQGSAVVGVRSKTAAVLAAVRRSHSELASYQKKIFKIDEHMAVGISGLVNDARLLSQFMRTETLNHRYVFSAPMQVGRLVQMVANKSQVYTQTIERRPYGVGLLVIGFDKTGPHLYETSPSGNFFEYYAHAFGARSQSARTYIEKNFEDFEEMKLDDLIFHALSALKSTLSDGDLTVDNTQLSFISSDGVPAGEEPLVQVLFDDDVAPFIERVNQAAAPAASRVETPMEDA
eukprot:GABV01001289.1.p1 GENE.GABV01001289.1~~GABV01001289.1.p1  ORF type:complete len:261 (-),score=87.42 GABV01001289.1:29-811(-)